MPKLGNPRVQEDHKRKYIGGECHRVRLSKHIGKEGRFVSRSSTPEISTGVPIHDLSTKSWEANNKLFNKVSPFIVAAMPMVQQMWVNEDIILQRDKGVLHCQLTANLNQHRNDGVADLKKCFSCQSSCFTIHRWADEKVAVCRSVHTVGWRIR